MKLRAVLLLSLTVACGSTKHDDTPSPGAVAGAPTENGGAPAQSETGGAAGAVDDVSQAGQHAGGEESLGGAAGADTAGGAGGSGGAVDEVPPVVVSGAFYGTSVESFTPGDYAGYNQDKLPDIVLGPPKGQGTNSGSTDVLSLGSGGEIVLGFGEHGITDGPGADFVVFENCFWPSGDESKVFAELGEISVSEDGKRWHTFACDTVGDGKGHFPGCAGYSPTLAYDPATLIPLDPKQSGGNAFDLADLGILRAHFIKIHDLKTQSPGGVSGGFDLDAIGVIHSEE